MKKRTKIVLIILAAVCVLAVLAVMAYGIFYKDIQISRNEASAVSSLRTLVSVEATWWAQDPDGSGCDHWTYDVSCLHRMYRADNSTKIAFIDIALAKADRRPAAIAGGTDPFGNPQIEDWTAISSTLAPKNGYYFQAMLRDENGQPYNQNEVGTNKIKAANRFDFAFVAYPAKYGITGINTYIVSETGTIYYLDTGSDENKIILQWPDQDLFSVIEPGGKAWQVIDYWQFRD